MSVKSQLYGRKAEKNIIEFLKDAKDGIDGLTGSVGGIGKTTLIQHIYKDDEVVCLFQLQGWVYISQEWN